VEARDLDDAAAAYTLLGSSATRDAFDLTREPTRFGRLRPGRVRPSSLTCLAAGRGGRSAGHAVLVPHPPSGHARGKLQGLEEHPAATDRSRRVRVVEDLEVAGCWTRRWWCGWANGPHADGQQGCGSRSLVVLLLAAAAAAVSAAGRCTGRRTARRRTRPRTLWTRPTSPRRSSTAWASTRCGDHRSLRAGHSCRVEAALEGLRVTEVQVELVMTSCCSGRVARCRGATVNWRPNDANTN
jgi:hypothetical protein